MRPAITPNGSITPLFPNFHKATEKQIPVTNKSCPVCLLQNPGPLAEHLAKYHNNQDMRQTIINLLRPRQIPSSLHYYIANTGKENVARILANFQETGYLQVPRK